MRHAEREERTFGTHLGHGHGVEQATAATRHTTEGVKSAEAVLALAHAHGVEMPITEVISALLHEKVTLDEAGAALMQRPPSPSADPYGAPLAGRTSSPSPSHPGGLHPCTCPCCPLPRSPSPSPLVFSLALERCS
ncbi:NAD(P)H-dependent glycerol-3-phosphate dehydrogenase [Streptomyces sp. ID05-47C]|uniref:NAD(P)H-dependent glycerol-3-phosphate dehydrogenase n=1 Tax=Streptomyces sp. ID05-47C TaxID=3028665 RepID=UPI0029ADABAC|nr:hypothetical protein [Streptomyces sp. ID05-47C]